MYFKETPLRGSFIVDLDLREDDRGFFARYFCHEEFTNVGLNAKWLQANNSMSRTRGTLRGLHFQRPPHAEVKLIRCVRGAIWDVAVDLRHNSETFGKWFGVTLTETNRKMFYVPRGFAHGFVSLEDNTEITYLVSDFYTPSAEGTVNWNDPDVAIEWPLDPLFISQKDKNGGAIRDLMPLIIDDQ